MLAAGVLSIGAELGPGAKFVRLGVVGPNASELFAFDQSGNLWCFGLDQLWQRAGADQTPKLQMLHWDEV
jgi:hypothetical protein